MTNHNAIDPMLFFRFCPACGASNFMVSGVNSKQCNCCGYHHYFNASGAVIVVIFNKNGELLVTKRAFEPQTGTFDFPGGFIAPGETAENAAIREVKEELNIEFEKLQYHYSLSNQYPFSGIIVHTIDMVFTAVVQNWQSIMPSDDVSEYIFMDRDSINPLLFGLDTAKLVAKSIKEGLL